MSSKANRLNKLREFSEANRYADLIEVALDAFEDLDAEELVLLAHASDATGRADVLEATCERLAEKLGPDDEHVLWSRLKLAALTDDLQTIRTVLERTDPTRWSNAAPQIADILAVMLRRNAWTDAERLLTDWHVATGIEDADDYLRRVAIILLIRRRRYNDAVRLAKSAQAAAAPEDQEDYVLMQARVHERSGQHSKAAATYYSVLKDADGEQKAYYRAARAAFIGGNFVKARKMIARTRQVGPSSDAIEFLEGFIQLESGHPREAFSFFRDLYENDPSDARAAIGLVRTMDQLASNVQTLALVDRLLEDCDDPALWVYRVELLEMLGRTDEARTQREALLRAHPWATGLDDFRHVGPIGHSPRLEGVHGPGAAEAVEIEAISGLRIADVIYQGSPDMFRPQWTNEDLRQRAGLIESLQVQARVIYALLMRETRTRYSKTKLGFTWALIEPMLHIAVFYTLWSYRDRGTIDGMPLILFLVTGFPPYFVFVHTFTSIVGSVRGSQTLLSHRVVTVLDVLLSKVVIEYCKLVVVFVILLFGIWLAGIDFDIYDPLQLFFTFAVFSAIGFGMGLVVEVFSRYINSLDKLFRVVIRFLYFTSGVMYPLSMLPYSVIQLLMWNPLLHLVSLTRRSFLETDPIAGITPYYPLFFAICLVGLALVSWQATQRKLLNA